MHLRLQGLGLEGAGFDVDSLVFQLCMAELPA